MAEASRQKFGAKERMAGLAKISPDHAKTKMVGLLSYAASAIEKREKIAHDHLSLSISALEVLQGELHAQLVLCAQTWWSSKELLTQYYGVFHKRLLSMHDDPQPRTKPKQIEVGHKLLEWLEPLIRAGWSPNG